MGIEIPFWNLAQALAGALGLGTVGGVVIWLALRHLPTMEGLSSHRIKLGGLAGVAVGLLVMVAHGSLYAPRIALTPAGPVALRAYPSGDVADASRQPEQTAQERQQLVDDLQEEGSNEQ